jgi:4-amino-4-deoxy-L-arabinose transferase-like glycosyltransferase
MSRSRAIAQQVAVQVNSTGKRAFWLRRFLVSVLPCLLVLLLAAFPRIVALDQVATVDELAPWYGRTLRFWAALGNGDWAATFQSGHPGVTTMWLGTLGLVAQRALTPYGWLTDTDSLLTLALLRAPLALTTSLCVALAYLLLRRLFGGSLALLAALLWALDPLLLAHGRVFHLDALLASFMTLSILALLVALQIADSAARRNANNARFSIFNLRFVMLSGVFAGLALLTKQPSLALLPTALLIVATSAWAQPGTLLVRLRWAVQVLLLWGLSALATAFVLWPALWVTPLQTLQGLIAAGRLEAGEGHANGNFFLGQPDDAPGALFYPVALALRLTPWAMLGVLLLPLALRLRRSRPYERRALLLLGVFVLLFGALMTLSPKKFDRYLLPVFPAVNVLAAAGLLSIVDYAGKRGNVQSKASQRSPDAGRMFNLQSAIWPSFVVAPVLLAALATSWWYFPHYLAYYNPLLGGGPTAQWALPVGWGEGYDEARDWLNAQVETEPIAVAARSNAILGRRATFDIVGLDDLAPGPADFPNYVALYVSNVQRQRMTPGAQWYLDNATPAHVVRLHGVEYVWIYQVPPPVPQPLVALFGPAVGLRGYDLTPPEDGQPLRLALFWEGRGATPGDALLFAHLIGPDGRRYAQVDLPPGGPGAPTSAWGAGRFYITALELALPENAPPGQYRVVVGLYDPATGARLPLSGAQPADASVAGADALELVRFERK